MTGLHLDAAPQRFAYPRQLERKYQRVILARGEVMRDLLLRELGPILDRFGPQLEAAAAARMDAVEDDATSALVSVIDEVADAFESVDPDVGALVDIGREVDRRQVRELKRVVVGLPFPADVTAAGLEVAWTADNVALIKSIDARFFAEVESAVRETVGRGTSTRDLTRQIQRRFEVSKSRARLIARDQIGKLNSNVAQHRQLSVGITEYIWQTSEDERVREEHEARNGKRFAWSDPPSDGHPGEPIQCRCVPIPAVEV